jgi:hypothetical protein
MNYLVWSDIDRFEPHIADQRLGKLIFESFAVIAKIDAVATMRFPDALILFKTTGTSLDFRLAFSNGQ